MFKKLKNSLAAAVVAVIASTTAATAALTVYSVPTTNGIVQKRNAQLTDNIYKSSQEIVNDINALSRGYNQSIEDKTAIINNAISVATSQEAMLPSQVAQADKAAKQLATNAKQANLIAQKVIDIKLDYSGKTGQGFQACKVNFQSKQLNKAVDDAKTIAFDKVKNLDNSPGQLATSQDAVQKRRDAAHKANFCGENEVGCTQASELAGADTNASVLFQSSAPNTKVGAAKDAVRQNILGTPYLAVPSTSGQTVTGQAYLFNVNRATSLAAFSAYSLAHLQAMSEVREDLKDESGKAVSPNDLIFNTVARYYGSPEAKKWHKSMLEQRPRGLLVEMAKMEGVGAYMDYQEYQTNQRIEGNIAAMTITTTLPMEEALDRQYKKISQMNIMNSVRAAP